MDLFKGIENFMLQQPTDRNDDDDINDANNDEKKRKFMITKSVFEMRKKAGGGTRLFIGKIQTMQTLSIK